MANPARGEVALRCGDRRLTLCLTLGALAEIEAVLAEGRAFDAAEMQAVLRALLKGGGEIEAAAVVAELPLRPADVAAAIAAALALAA